MGESTPQRSPRRRRRLPRILRRAVLLLVALPLLVALGTSLALRSRGVRQAVLARVATMLASGYGLAFSATDFTLQWRAGAVELRNVRLGAPGGPPLATVGRLRAVVDLGSLRSRPLVVRALAVDRLRVDLAAPLPRLPASPPSPPGARPAIEIRRFDLTRGEVAGAPLPGSAATWLRSWVGQGIDARGSYRGGVARMEVERAALSLDRPGFGRQRLSLAASVRYQETQPLRVAGLRLTGDGLHLTAAGTIGLDAAASTVVDFDLDAAARALAAGLPPRGTVVAAGHLALPEGSGRVRLTASDVPAEALAPYLEPRLFARLALAGTRADLRADVTLGPGSWQRVAGEADAVWRQGDRPLARVALRLAPGASAAPLVATVTGAVLPESPGRRAFAGTVRAAAWSALAEATAENVRAELRVPDLAAALAEVRSLWPGLVPAPPPEAPLRGALTAEARVDGPLVAPRVRADATWLPRTGARLRVSARGWPRSLTGEAKVRAEAMPLALLGSLVPGVAGTLTGSAELSGGPRGFRAHAEAAAGGLMVPLALAGGLTTARADDLHLTADGTLRLSPLRWEGPLALAADHAELEGRARADRIAVAAEGRLAGTPLVYVGKATLAGDALEAPGVALADHLELAADGEVGADLRSASARVRLDVPSLTLVEGRSELRDLHLEAEGTGGELRIASLSGELPRPATVEAGSTSPAAESPGRRTFEASGTVALDPLLSRAELALHLVRPLDGVADASLTASLRDGVLGVEAPNVDTASGPARLYVHVPLGQLRQLPQLAEAVGALPGTDTAGPLTLTLEAPSLDSAALLAALGEPPRPERLRGGLSADLSLDLAAPAAGSGEVRLADLALDTPRGRVSAGAPMLLRLAGGRLELLPVHLSVEGGVVPGAGLDLRASADLAPAWRPLTDPLAAAVTRLAASGAGTVDAALLDPYLEGGVAEGALSVSGHVEGPPDRLAGAFTVDGRPASFVWPGAALHLEGPRLAVGVEGGHWTLSDGGATLNGGALELSGDLSPDGELALEARLAQVGYRLPYGIATQLSGQLAFHAPAAGRSRLSGRVVVDRGVLDRDLDLDRELLTLVLQPAATASTEEDALAGIDLDLAIETIEGVRVRNNVGDLHAGWRRLTLGGTLASPVLRGRIELDPGGLFYAYGQTVRIDRGSLLFTGDPATDPQIDLATTSSLDDPSISRLRGASPLDFIDQQTDRGLGAYAPGGEREQAGTGEVLSSGLASYYGARLVERLSQSLGLGGFTVTPALVFGETDPSARLTVGHNLSPSVAVALSLDLRNAERQTYLLYVDSVPGLPGLRLEGFTSDAGREGASLQQSFELGGGAPPQQQRGPRLHRIRLTTPLGRIAARRLRGAIGLTKREAVPPGAAFGVEVDLAEFLRQRGYPDPHVEVALPPVAGRDGWVDLVVSVDPGPHVDFTFAGDAPPRGLRPAITGLYRTDFYEPIAREEMRQATVRAFRATGHLDPQVTIEVAREHPEDARSRRTVTVRTEAGPRRRLDVVEIAGVDAETSRLAVASFRGTLARAELAAGLPTANRLLLASLRGLGYPEAKISGRSLAADGSRLVVDVEPGTRQTIAAVEVRGVEGDERERLTALLAIHVGDPARVDRISEGSLRLANDLRRRGHADAEVRSVVVPAADRSAAVEVAYEVTPGIAYRLAAVDFSGARSSRTGALRRQADLATGGPLDERTLERARGRLLHTGLFSRVDTDVDKTADGSARATFSLLERPRYQVGYGVRWESSVGAAAVLDLIDRNFLGRALTLGLRGLYQDDDRSGRLYLSSGGLLGTQVSLESYALRRRRLFPGDNLIEDSSELALQASRPLGAADTARLYLRYRSSHLFEIDPDPFFPFDTKLHLPYLGAELVRDTRDDGIDPHTGLLATVDVSGSGAFLGSDLEYVRVLLQGAYFRPFALGGSQLTWAQGARLGVAHPFAGQEVVFEERFFAGGPFSVRGYERESLGPVETLGGITRVLGGEALFTLNEELRVPLPWNLAALAFLDAGQVWARPGEASLDLAKSLGLGLRAHTPVGLLRFDAAYPLDRRPGDARYKLYFGFGNAF